MYKPSESLLPDRSKMVGERLAVVSRVALVAVTAMVLLLPRGAAAGAGAGGDDRVVSQAARLQRREQEGTRRLSTPLLAVRPPTVRRGAGHPRRRRRQGAKMVAIDRHGGPLIVTDPSGTTCLARPSAPTQPRVPALRPHRQRQEPA